MTATTFRDDIAQAIRNGAPIIVRPRNNRPYVILTTPAETEPAGSVDSDSRATES